jgi:phage gpG-like protein
MIRIRDNARDVLKGVQRFTVRLVDNVRRELDKQNRLTINHIARTRLSFPRNSSPGMAGLRVQTGNLRRGLLAGLVPSRQSGGAVVGSIQNNVKYAAIHEYGGTISPAGKIVAKNGRALRFSVGGVTLFRRSVNQTRPIYIPARAPIRHGIEERSEIYSEAISRVILQTFRSS